MSYKPSDFFVGVIDFFAIILPGRLLTFDDAKDLLAKAWPLIERQLRGSVLP